MRTPLRKLFKDDIAGAIDNAIDHAIKDCCER